MRRKRKSRDNGGKVRELEGKALKVNGGKKREVKRREKREGKMREKL